MNIKPRIALIWAQFSAYHVDRLEAVGARLSGRADVISVEVAPQSATYAWAPSAEVRFTRKIRLFEGVRFEDVPFLQRWWRMIRATWRCDTVYVGIGYNEPDVLLLAIALRLLGVRVIMLTASKWDDRTRFAGFEFFKALLLAVFSSALVGGRRQAEYVHFLGFRRRIVRVGANTVDVERIRLQAATHLKQEIPFHDRSFVYVGRFVRKKLLEQLIEAYAAYVRRCCEPPHRLLLIGSGELESDLRELAKKLNIAHLIDWPGFLDAPVVAAMMARSLALVLVSEEEQWGLVVNEALALGIPVIVSSQIGAREALVRNLENGFVVEPGSTVGLTEAMHAIAACENRWKELSAGATARAWLGDSQRFADAVELFTFPDSVNALRHYGAFATSITATGDDRDSECPEP